MLEEQTLRLPMDSTQVWELLADLQDTGEHRPLTVTLILLHTKSMTVEMDAHGPEVGVFNGVAEMVDMRYGAIRATPSDAD